VMYAPMIGAKSVISCFGILSRAVMIAPPPQRAVCDGGFSPEYAAMLLTVCCSQPLGRVASGRSIAHTRR
jgi:hypothetical protein